MNYKVCNRCSDNLPATREHFHVLQKGKYGLRAVCKKCMAAQFKAKYVPIPKKTEKVCGRCKITFPLTDEYFFKKLTKKGTLINGKPLRADSISYRSVCKNCNNAQNYARQRAKLLIKYNASSYEELDEIIYAMRTRAGMLGAYASLNVPSKRRKYQYPPNASIAEMQRIRKIYDRGFDPSTYNTEWRKKWLDAQKRNRKHDYPEEYDIIPQKLKSKAQSDALKDGFIANRLGFKLEDVPQELLELKRKQLKFYRYVKEKKANR